MYGKKEIRSAYTSLVDPFTYRQGHRKHYLMRQQGYLQDPYCKIHVWNHLALLFVMDKHLPRIQ